MSDTIDYLLIGGFAAAHAAKAIRERDKVGKVVLVNAEAFLPYDRPPLSKQALADPEFALEETRTFPADFYEQNNIELRLQTKVTGIDRAARTVQLEDGEVLEYGKLLLAPGALAPSPDFPGADFPNVYLVRTRMDDEKLRAALGCAERVVVIGGSYLGLEAASGCLNRRIDVTVIDSHDGPWSKFASPQLKQFLIDEFEKRGAKFRFNERVEKINGDAYAESVETEDGPLLCDLVIAAAGSKLNTRLAQAAGLELHEKHGILVDETLRTGDENIWVAGDCAAYPDPFVGTRWHNEHYMNARWQGTLAGANMTGENKKFGRIPYFFSDLLDLHMILRGSPAGGKSKKVLGSMESGEFIELYCDENDAVKMAVAISHDEAKVNAVAEALEPFLWAAPTAGETSEADFEEFFQQ